MARDREYVGPATFAGPTSMIASARRLDLRGKRDDDKAAKVRKDGWQDSCWYFYDIIGEFYYGMNWLGNLLSRARLIVLNAKGEEVTEGPAREYLDALFGGPIAQGEMLRQLGIHLGVAGEGYVIGESKGEDDPDVWCVASNSRLSGNTISGFKLDNRPLVSPLVLRIFRPHPLDPSAATSSARPALPILAQLEGLVKRTAADIDSRLTGNGILLLPSEVNFPSSPVTENAGEPNQTDVRTGADGVQDSLIQAASIAIQNPESAAAKIPLVFTMPGERIAQAKHLTFWSEFDEKAPELEDRAIRRLALALDMPPEALTGTAEMNHWNAWQLEEAAIKVHTEPMLQLITDALTTKYLWPLLEDDNVPDARGYKVAADTTELRLRPNRSKEAQELYDRGALSIDAMLRENGFDPSEKMEGEELRDWFVRKVASGSTTPELVAEALRILGVPVAPTVTAPATEPTEARPTPSLAEHPERNVPNDGVPPEVTAAAEVLVYRALERAGNRLKNRGHKPPKGTHAAELYSIVPFKQSEIDELLTDAWSAAKVFGMDRYVPAMDAYTRSILASRSAHDRESLNRFLAKAA